ncbi:hypothetical protein [Dactylosporangium fulvum]|uniref:Helix-turn-helix domain-containing protein n=1 Tax=Dactylosporangium fulvum TaxID=53359 RepID=A0ABY5VV09_9ACTN|nr:hypothetical protein [Dactylosporangium fulvum]UWP81587.1 hypothetical protein Dfulv_41795 [Dactylosporangium fulvum]
MAALKQWSGLTYRQLQRRAQQAGDVLPHSTAAAALTRTTLPREDVVAAFVRACGGDESSVARWLATRKRIAAATVQGTAEPTQPTTDSDGPVPLAPALAAQLVSGRVPTPPELDPAATQPKPDLAATQPEPDPAAAQPDERLTESPAIVEPPIGVEVVRSAAPELTADRLPESDWSEGDWSESDLLGPDQPRTRSALNNAVAEQDRGSWTGIHRYDPAVEVPRPAGIRWLIPPIAYRTGWAARVLSGVLVLLLMVVATAITVGFVRGHGSDRTSSPSISVSETADPDTDDLGTDPDSGPVSTGPTTPPGANRTESTATTAPAPSTSVVPTPVVPGTTGQPGPVVKESRTGPAAQPTTTTATTTSPTSGPNPGSGGGKPPVCTGLVCTVGPTSTTTPPDCTRGCVG